GPAFQRSAQNELSALCRHPAMLAPAPNTALGKSESRGYPAGLLFVPATCHFPKISPLLRPALRPIRKPWHFPVFVLRVPKTQPEQGILRGSPSGGILLAGTARRVWERSLRRRFQTSRPHSSAVRWKASLRKFPVPGSETGRLGNPAAHFRLRKWYLPPYGSVPTRIG